MAELPDEELVAQYRAHKGSPLGRSLIGQLFERHHARVAAWCFRMTGQVDSAADLAQEVFLKAFQNLDSFQGSSRFTTWLYAIARNHCMDELRSRAARPAETAESVLDDLADERAEEISLAMERRESLASLRQLMRESLDETEGKVMTLHYLHELPLESVTRLLGLTNASGAKAYIVSARRKLSRAFERMREREPGGKGRRNAI